MAFPSDSEIARNAQMKPMEHIARNLGLVPEDIETYGSGKAKIRLEALRRRSQRKSGRLILVTAITPTPAGEGKTTTSVGLGDALARIGKRTVVALREPSLGPVFGMKGGAAGGGYAQVVPMEDINLHFTGDMHAVTAANNLLAAMTDNHIYQGNVLDIDPEQVSWKRCMDMNDRQLRHITSGLGGMKSGVPRDDGFDITAASEVMAVLCLADSLEDLRTRLGRIVVARTRSGKDVTASMLRAEGAMTALLRDAFRPNLVQTLENTPSFIHGGPFANIAHGCSTVTATRLALRLAEYTVTEAGFGADLGAEKFINIKCRTAGLYPDAVVLVATLRALRHHGGADRYNEPDTEAVRGGMPNLLRHLDNLTQHFGLPSVVAINRFPTDTAEETALVVAACRERGVQAIVSDVFAQGGDGGIDLAREVVRLAESGSAKTAFTYADEDALEKKIQNVACTVYGAKDVDFSAEAKEKLQRFEQNGYGALPVCMAKTQYSFSDDAKAAGAPEGFTLHIRDARLSAGAGFVVALTGSILTMPGLPVDPGAERIATDTDGNITGLF